MNVRNTALPNNFAFLRTQTTTKLQQTMSKVSKGLEQMAKTGFEAHESKTQGGQANWSAKRAGGGINPLLRQAHLQQMARPVQAQSRGNVQLGQAGGKGTSSTKPMFRDGKLDPAALKKFRQTDGLEKTYTDESRCVANSALVAVLQGGGSTQKLSSLADSARARMDAADGTTDGKVSADYQDAYDKIGYFKDKLASDPSSLTVNDFNVFADGLKTAYDQDAKGIAKTTDAGEKLMSKIDDGNKLTKADIQGLEDAIKSTHPDLLNDPDIGGKLQTLKNDPGKATWDDISEVTTDATFQMGKKDTGMDLDGIIALQKDAGLNPPNTFPSTDYGTSVNVSKNAGTAYEKADGGGFNAVDTHVRPTQALNTERARLAESKVWDNLSNGENAMIGVSNKNTDAKGKNIVTNENHMITAGKLDDGTKFVYDPANDPAYMTGNDAEKHLNNRVAVDINKKADGSFDVTPTITVVPLNP